MSSPETPQKSFSERYKYLLIILWGIGTAFPFIFALLISNFLGQEAAFSPWQLKWFAILGTLRGMTISAELYKVIRGMYSGVFFGCIVGLLLSPLFVMAIPKDETPSYWFSATTMIFVGMVVGGIRGYSATINHSR